jgi:hypothetical protein
MNRAYRKVFGKCNICKCSYYWVYRSDGKGHLNLIDVKECSCGDDTDNCVVINKPAKDVSILVWDERGI